MPRNSSRTTPNGSLLDARSLYEAMVRYLVTNGWRREELGSGWWWREDQTSEGTVEEAFAQQLEIDGIDLRTMLSDEPQEFWG